MGVSRFILDENYKKTRKVFLYFYLTILSYLVFIADDRYVRMKFFFEGLKNGNAFSCGLINVIPFKTISSYFVNYKYFGMKLLVINILGNVVVFMPFGLLLAALTKAKYKFFEVLYYSVMLSTAIEAIQNLTKVGVFDVDDIILNTIGGILGYLIYKYIFQKHKIED